MDYRVESCFSLGWLVSETQAESLPERYEPLLSEDGLVETSLIIEDELLLSLPIVSYHDEDQCAVSGTFVSEDENVDTGSCEEKPNPFDALLALKKK